MLKVNRHSIARLMAVVVSSLFVCMLNNAAAASSLYKNIDEMKIQSSQLNNGWQLDQEIAGNEQALKKFGFIYQKMAKQILNQIFVFNNKAVQVNYCLFDEEQDTEIVELKMRSIVNNLNIILKKRNVIVEILSEDGFLKQEAILLLDAAPMLKGSLLERGQVPSDWALSQVILVEDAKLPFFRNKLGGKVENILNQVFSVGKDILKINYVAGSNAQESQKIMIIMSKNRSDQTKIRQRGGVIIEVITSNKSLMEKAIALF